MSDIPARRLVNQCLTSTHFTSAEEVVSWFGAVQAQDFAAAKWALALRCKGQTDATIEQAFNEGKILRTHIMRPTWHFVTPTDIRWMLALTSPRVHAFNGSYYRKSGLDKAIFAKSNAVLKNVLRGGRQLTRAELDVYLREANIPTQDLGLSYTIMQAELDGIICSGPKRGKQFTYMLLEERVPKTKELSRGEALYELSKRYFQSHGPAQAQDFAWWSGLTLTDARKGLELLGVQIQKQENDGRIYWSFESKQDFETRDSCFLVPGFDEYFIAYKDRSGILDRQYAKELNQGGGMVSGAVVVRGRMVGGWRRAFEKKSVVITVRLFEKITAEQQKLLEEQVGKYGEFIELPVSLTTA